MRYFYTTLVALASWGIGAGATWAQTGGPSYDEDLSCPHCRHQAMESHAKAAAQNSMRQAPQKKVNFVYSFSAQKVYRIKSLRNNYLQVHNNHARMTPALLDPSDLSTAWILTRSGQGYTLRNAQTGMYLQSVNKDNTILSTSPRPTTFYIRKSTGAAYSNKYQLSWNQNFSDKDCLHEDGQSKVVRWSANENDRFSNWAIEEVKEITVDQVRKHIQSNSNFATNITHQQTYRLVNAAYGERAIGIDYYSGALDISPIDTTSLAQLWTLEEDKGRYRIKSLVSGAYIQNETRLSTLYETGERPFAFKVAKNTSDWLTSFAFGGSHHLHSNSSYQLVTWHNDQAASRWFLQPVTPDAQQLKQTQDNYTKTKNMARNAATYTKKLDKFFTDKACTQLRSSYATLSDQELTKALQDEQLPEELQQIVLRVKNDTWSTDTTANRLEKGFRIANYKAYSDHVRWHQSDMVGTGFRFSRLTSPTGITIEAGKPAYIFVDAAPRLGCSLMAEIVQGFNTTGTQTRLHPGLNIVAALEPSHIYIYYNIDNVALKLADCPDIKIHIEGGRANGYFDLSRHSNLDWQAMKRLSNHGFLLDETLRLKSTYYCMSLHLDQAKAAESRNAWHHRGTYRGLTGILQKMDEINKMERDLIGADRFKDRFNCMHFASSNGQHDFLYATNYGIYLKNSGTFLNYKTYTEGSNNYGGGDLWAVAHETGHHFQHLFDLTVCRESSVNLFSNIAVFNQGSNVSRGPSMLNFTKKFNDHMPWVDRTLADRIFPYYQLWLYFEQLGHHPGFYAELCDRFRKDPLQQRNAATDYLKFARTVCDIAQEDLTEFFEFHGFLDKKKVGNVQMTWGDSFYDKYYGPVKMFVPANEVEATRRYMARYPKKKARNILFIDDRIRRYAATHEGAGKHTMKLGTTQGVVPGQASSVGEVGMFHDFAKDASTATIEQATLSKRTVRVKGKGIVGYKVYDANHRLVYVSNMNNFVLPHTLDLNTIELKVAAGNGDEITIMKEGKILDKFIVTGIVNTEIAAPSTTPEAPEAAIYDLTGRRVQKAQRGVYIQGGKIKVAQ